MPYVALIDDIMMHTLAIIKPKSYDIISMKPCETVSSTVQVSSAQKAIPIGIIGIRNIAPIIIVRPSK